MRKVGEKDHRGNARVRTVNNGESLTVQSDAHLADINTIMQSFAQGGLAALDEADLMFKDVSEFTDLRDALEQAKEAETFFMALPSKVREVFEHSVAVWLDTAHDEEKRNALVEAGFLKRVEDPAFTPKGEPQGEGGAPGPPVEGGTEGASSSTPPE